jgi:hypothetical protein
MLTLEGGASSLLDSLPIVVSDFGALKKYKSGVAEKSGDRRLTWAVPCASSRADVYRYSVADCQSREKAAYAA